jgi:hypothetical protein
MPKNPADLFAGEGSFAGKLRKRREAIEAGDPEQGREEMIGNADGGDADGGSHDMPDNRYRRGYRTNQ